MTAQNSWLFADNDAVLRAAWTAMDQTYSNVTQGTPLIWIDDQADDQHPARPAPWVVPSDWVVADSISAPLNGKFVIYKNPTTHQVMIVPMGTKGGLDVPGWLSNAQTTGLSQWNDPGVQKAVFSAANKALEDVQGQQLIVAGDSKGGALAQYVVQTLEQYKNADNLASSPLFNTPAIRALSNSNIGLIARVAPGVSQQLGSGFTYNSQQYDGIQAFYSAPKMQDGSADELISKFGGNYLEGVNQDGTTNFYVHSDGVVPSEDELKRNFWNIPILRNYPYLHRLAFSDADAVVANLGDFSTVVQGATDKKTSLDFSHMQSLGFALSGNGQGPQVSNAEAAVRLATQVITAVTESPMAALDSVAQGSSSTAEIDIGLIVAAVPGLEETLLSAEGYSLEAIEGINLYHSMVDYWNNHFGSKPISPGGETYTATATSSGINLQGSGGDTITTSRSGNTTTVTLGNGSSITTTDSQDGTAFSNATWSFNGVQGSQQTDASGVTTSKTIYSGGSYVTTTDDGRGNVSTDYYSKNGTLYSWSWIHADGSSGSATRFANGLTIYPSNSQNYLSMYFNQRDPDGKYSVSSMDPNSIQFGTVYDANGNVVTQQTQGAIGENYDTSNTTSQTQTGSDGSTITRNYDSLGHLVSDQWTKTDGTSGNDKYNESHAVSGKTTHADGSYETYSVYQNNYGTSTNFAASPAISFPVLGPYDVTRDQYDAGGSLTSDQWQLFDGTSGSDTFASDGSGSGTATYSDGRTSTLTVGSDHSITIQNYDSNGNKSSLDWWHADGTHGITVQHSDGSTELYAYEADGTVQETDFAADHSMSYEDTLPAGAVISPDGSLCAQVKNGDGSYTVNFTDSGGNASIFKFSSGGTLESTDHVSVADSGPYGAVDGVLPDGTPYTSPYNTQTPVVTKNGTTYTIYLSNGGSETGDRWVKDDGTHGFDTFNSDGSKEGSSYNQDGSFYTYVDDGKGNTQTNYFDTTGTWTGNAWKDSDNSQGQVTVNSDGTESGRDQAADGSYGLYTDDGQGTEIDNQYTASGIKTSDEWRNPDGSTGTDTFNADGSTSGYASQNDGSYSTYALDATGNGLRQFYSAERVFEQQRQTVSDGHGNKDVITFDAAGNTLSRAITTAGGVSYSDSWSAGSAGNQSNLTVSRDDNAAISGPSGGGVVTAWGRNDTITAGAGSTVIDAWGASSSVVGGAGNDTLAALAINTTLVGGSGDTLFEVSDSSDLVIAPAGSGHDTIESWASYQLPNNIDVLTLLGSANLTGTGNDDAANLITANSGNDTLIAGSGSDTLVSGSGVDVLVGGSGADVFVINNSADTIQRSADNHLDVVQSSVNYTLTAPIDTLTLTGSGNLVAKDAYGYAVVTGNSGNDTLIAGNGADTLVAGSGVDTLIGGISGSTTFVINNTADVIQVSGPGASYYVQSSVNYTLGQYLDNLVLTGAGALVGQGNSDATNYIRGNSGNDTLIAGSGADTLVAGSGVDTLIAGSGNDLLEGNAGDTYVLNSGFGNSRIETSSGTAAIEFGTGIAATDLTLGLGRSSTGTLQLLIQDGTKTVTVDGGATGTISQFDFANGNQLSLQQLLAQTNTASTTLAGANGNAILDTTPADSVSGGVGNDTLIGAGDGDTVIAGIGNQQLYGLGKNDVLVGGIGDDTLYGGSGGNTLVAGAGNTTIYAGTGSNSYMLTRGGTATLIPDNGSGTQTIFLPPGMTPADFTSYEGQSGNLILESLSGDTTVVVKGFYTSSSNKLWLLADDSGSTQLVADWAVAPHSPGSSYHQEIELLRQAHAADLPTQLNDAGMNKQTVDRRPIEGDSYHFTGTSVQNLTVQNGSLSVDTSENFTENTTTVSGGTRTETYSIPIYSTVTVPGHQWSVSVNDPNFINVENNLDLGTASAVTRDANGQITGYTFTTPSQTNMVQTGARTVTVSYPVVNSYTTDTQGFVDYNIVGDGADDSITANAPFVGTVNTGDGNVYVNLGLYDSFWSDSTNQDHRSYDPSGPLPLGAFIEAGNGNDTIVGTGGNDTIAAGTGFDQLYASLGSTFYVPLSGDSTDIIESYNAPFYGNGPFPHSTLVLPDGIKPTDLNFKLFQDQPYANGTQTDNSLDLQITYGNSTIILPFDADPAIGFDGTPGTSQDSQDGVSRFQFSDGTVLTRAQVLAMAGSALSMSGYNPVVSASNPTVEAGSSIAGASLFSVADSGSSKMTWYQISNTGGNGGYFMLGDTYEQPGHTFYVSNEQLSQLVYTAGSAGQADVVQISAFDGLVWGAATSINVEPTAGSNVFQATGPNQQVLGSASGPDTLIGGFGGDTLVGASGQDTFVYNQGGGAETISETATPVASDNATLQFGSGITRASISLSAASGQLLLNLGGGDQVAILGFDLSDPLNGTGIKTFAFADGTNLSMQQLLSDAQVTGSSGTLTNADGSTINYSFTPTGSDVYSAQTVDASGQTIQQVALSNGGTLDVDNYTYLNGNVSRDTEVVTPADGSGSTTTVYDFNAQGQWTNIDITNPDGSTDNSTLTYNADGTSSRTEVTTPAGGGGSTTSVFDYDTQGRWTSLDVTNPDGSTDNSTFTYNADGTSVKTEVTTPAGGGGSTTTVFDTDAQGRWTSVDVTNPDGSTSDTSYTYQADGSTIQTVVDTPADHSSTTTTVVDINNAGQQVSQNTYQLSADGSYHDDWQAQDGSSGTYWWNASSREYEDSWTNSDGSSWTDDYQFAAGGSPASSGISFTETYTASDGSHGTRQFDSSAGTTSLNWYSSITGNLSGTTTDSGFIGLQNDGELTNTTPDLTFFNPATSPHFQEFLAGH